MPEGDEPMTVPVEGESGTASAPTRSVATGSDIGHVPSGAGPVSGKIAAVLLDARMPDAIALAAEDLGVRKARTDPATLFALAVLAGAFIALGGLFATVVMSGATTGTEITLPYGVTRLLGGLVFSLGLILVIVGGAQERIEVPQDAILVAEDLAPSDIASIDRTRVLGFCTTSGGATSHVAIIARSFGIPAICGIDESVLHLDNGAQVLLDGGRGMLRRNPNQAEVARAREQIARSAERRREELATAMQPAQTRDGYRIEVVANIRNADDALAAVAAGGEGVGLLRSEFLFDERDQAPSEDEQARSYGAVAEVLGRGRPLIIRTLDVGGDKPLSYLPLPKEENPFLGLRGIRVSLDQPEMFRTQLRAILRAAPLSDLHIMFPMIATLEELRAAKRILAEEQA
jgi:phosphohistidine swiveling domain-containing protein